MKGSARHPEVSLAYVLGCNAIVINVATQLLRKEPSSFFFISVHSANRQQLMATPRHRPLISNPPVRANRAPVSSGCDGVQQTKLYLAQLYVDRTRQ